MTALAHVHTARQGSSPAAVAPATRHARAAQPVPKLRYIVVVLTGIFAILGIQLLLSIAVSGGAYEIAALKGEMRTSQQELQIVAEDINALVAPSTLAGLATAMGMVADNNPAYLKLSTGEVLGEAVPAAANGSSVMYSVTGGGETLTTPAIVDSVLRSVALAQTSTEEEILDVASQQVVAESVTPVTPQATTPVATAVTPIEPTPAPQPVKRYGGTIPSPITR
jgi:hypothetical protein